MAEMKRIASFEVDHDYILPGIYVSRIDGDITTYDLRTRRPNCGDYMDDLTMHSVEHMLATYLRGGELSDNIIYFGPMGCQTGFYLLVRGANNDEVLGALKTALERTIDHDGEMFGNSRRECGNYKNLSLDAAKIECRRYLDVLSSRKQTFEYPKEETVE